MNTDLYNKYEQKLKAGVKWIYSFFIIYSWGAFLKNSGKKKKKKTFENVTHIMISEYRVLTQDVNLSCHVLLSSFSALCGLLELAVSLLGTSADDKLVSQQDQLWDALTVLLIICRLLMHLPAVGPKLRNPWFLFYVLVKQNIEVCVCVCGFLPLAQWLLGDTQPTSDPDEE